MRCRFITKLPRIDECDAPAALRARCCYSKFKSRTTIIHIFYARSWVIRLTLMKWTIFRVHFCFVNLTKISNFPQQQHRLNKSMKRLMRTTATTITREWERMNELREGMENLVACQQLHIGRIFSHIAPIETGSSVNNKRNNLSHCC